MSENAIDCALWRVPAHPRLSAWRPYLGLAHGSGTHTHQGAHDYGGGRAGAEARLSWRRGEEHADSRFCIVVGAGTGAKARPHHSLGPAAAFRNTWAGVSSRYHVALRPLPSGEPDLDRVMCGKFARPREHVLDQNVARSLIRLSSRFSSKSSLSRPCNSHDPALRTSACTRAALRRRAVVLVCGGRRRSSRRRWRRGQVLWPSLVEPPISRMADSVAVGSGPAVTTPRVLFGCVPMGRRYRRHGARLGAARFGRLEPALLQMGCDVAWHLAVSMSRSTLPRAGAARSVVAGHLGPMCASFRHSLERETASRQD